MPHCAPCAIDLIYPYPCHILCLGQTCTVTLPTVSLHCEVPWRLRLSDLYPKTLLDQDILHFRWACHTRRTDTQSIGLGVHWISITIWVFFWKGSRDSARKGTSQNTEPNFVHITNLYKVRLAFHSEQTNPNTHKYISPCYALYPLGLSLSLLLNILPIYLQCHSRTRTVAINISIQIFASLLSSCISSLLRINR